MHNKSSKNKFFFRKIISITCITVWSLLCGISRQKELISQAAQILGSVDFLGNPMGLLNDVTEGVSELIKYGNVGGLIRNVTHGVSNSAAKVRLCKPVYTWHSLVVSVPLCTVLYVVCYSLQGLCQTGWGRPWTTGTRVSESTSDTMEPLVESTWLQGSMDWLMVQNGNILCLVKVTINREMYLVTAERCSFSLAKGTNTQYVKVNQSY